LSKTYALAKPTDPSSTSFLVRQLDEHFLVASTWFGPGGVHRGVVVRVGDGVEVARMEEQVTTAVARQDGALEGLVVTQPGLRFLEPSGASRWTSKVTLDDATSALLVDRTLVIASFHPIAT